MDSKSDSQKENEKAFAEAVKNKRLEVGIYLAALRGKVQERIQNPENFPESTSEYAMLAKHQSPAFREDPKSPVMVLEDELEWAELPKEMEPDWEQSPKIKIFEWAEKVKDFLGESGCDTFDPDTESFYVLTESHEHLRNFFVVYQLAKYLITQNQT